jgi:hypothetical protein
LTSYISKEVDAQVRELAAKFRNKHGMETVIFGYVPWVFIFNGEVRMWKSELGRPDAHTPGTFAVPRPESDSRIYAAVGGTVLRGAGNWQECLL